MYKNGQLRRKTGGGFYRIKKLSDGNKIKEVYNPTEKKWTIANKIENNFNSDLFLDKTPQGSIVWNIMGSTLLYAAELIPEIANDIVNVDRAMKWGFAWQQGPFEMLDKIGIKNVISTCDKKNIQLPKMLKICKEKDIDSFYKDDEYLSIEGIYKKINSIQ